MPGYENIIENQKPAVGVIVPVYNAEAFIERCAESILGQTYGNVRLYLIDDGSKDGSAAVIDGIAAKYRSGMPERKISSQDENTEGPGDGRVVVLHKANEGPMKTALRGVRESKEPYLMFVDGDDWIESDCLEKMMAALLPDPGMKQVICGGYVIDREWNDTHQNMGNGALPGVYEGEKLKHEIRDKILGNETRTLTMSRCMKVISRELIEENAHYCDPSIRMGDDLNVMLPALLDAERIVVLKDNYDYHYIFRKDSLVHHYDAGMYENHKKLKAIIGRILSDKGVPDAENMTEREFLFLLFILMKNEIRNKDAAAVQRTLMICRNEDTPKLIAKYSFPVNDRANRLLLFFMRKPSVTRVKLVREVFAVRDKISGS